MSPSDARAGRRPTAPRPGVRDASVARSGAGRTRATRTGAAGPAVDPDRRRDSLRPAARRVHLTGRAAVLLVVVAALAVTLAWPARALVEQHRQVSALRAGNVATEQRVAELQHQLQRWQDPAYVEAQARARLHFVRPGETPYVVLGSQSTPAQVTPRVVERVRTPWYDALWQSVQGAASDAR